MRRIVIGIGTLVCLGFWILLADSVPAVRSDSLLSWIEFPGADLEYRPERWDTSRLPLSLSGSSPRLAESAVLGRAVSGISAPGALLYWPAGSETLWGRDVETPRPAASMTKLMSVLLAQEYLRDNRIGLEESVRIGESCAAAALPSDAARAGLRAGMELSWRELLAQAVVVSANDSACGLAEAVGGTEAGFVARMNARAESLGLKGARFVDPMGWSGKNRLSPIGMAELAAFYIRSFPEALQRWHKRKTLRLPDGSVRTNTNRLLQDYPAVDGLKTGYTDEAGFNFSATAERPSFYSSEPTRLIAVVMGLESPKLREGLRLRAAEAETLLSWGFKHFLRLDLRRFKLNLKIGSADFSLNLLLGQPIADLFYSAAGSGPGLGERATFPAWEWSRGYTYRLIVDESRLFEYVLSPFSSVERGTQPAASLELYYDGVRLGSSPVWLSGVRGELAGVDRVPYRVRRRLEKFPGRLGFVRRQHSGLIRELFEISRNS